MMFSWWPSPIKVFSGNQLLSRFSTRLCHWVLVLFWELSLVVGMQREIWNMASGINNNNKKIDKMNRLFPFSSRDANWLQLVFVLWWWNKLSKFHNKLACDNGWCWSGRLRCRRLPLIFRCVLAHEKKKKTVFLSFRRGWRFIHRMEAHHQKTSSVWNCRMWWEFKLMIAAAGNGYISILLDYCSIYAF